MKYLYVCKTKIGEFFIVEHNGRFFPIFREESLGSYATPEQALDDLVGGHTFSPSSNIDTTKLGIPRELSDWDRLSD